ncbi:unnamed protein product, partial [Vitis vinifera]|uniref:Uncharacterized protein n=1 Tax=Vitis vinifera TaxID=29760 RepID=D7TUF1_VITVI
MQILTYPSKNNGISRSSKLSLYLNQQPSGFAYQPMLRQSVSMHRTILLLSGFTLLRQHHALFYCADGVVYTILQSDGCRCRHVLCFQRISNLLKTREKGDLIFPGVFLLRFFQVQNELVLQELQMISRHFVDDIQSDGEAIGWRLSSNHSFSFSSFFFFLLFSTYSSPNISATLFPLQRPFISFLPPIPGPQILSSSSFFSLFSTTPFLLFSTVTLL